MRKIERIFVHCTGGPQMQKVEDILGYWKKTLKWKHPGYHYIIKADGEIVQLQPESIPSNGVAGYNSTSINVCYIGGVDKAKKPIDNRTQAQKDALYGLLMYLKQQYPKAHILGHRDIWGKDSRKWKKWCPCFDAEKEYAGIDNDIKEAKTPTGKPIDERYLRPESYIENIKKLAPWNQNN